MTLLSVRNLEVHLPTTHGVVHAVNGLDLDIAASETVGLIGESGCGKSTLGKALLRLVPSTGGSISLAGQDITHLDARGLKPVRPKIQMVFQDNASALNPRHTVGQSISQPLRLNGWSKRDARTHTEGLLEIGRAHV